MPRCEYGYYVGTGGGAEFSQGGARPPWPFLRTASVWVLY